MKRFILSLCLFPTSIFAQSLFESKPVLVYSDSTKYVETSPYAAILEDANKEFSIEQIMTMPDSCFHWAKPGRLNLGNSCSRFWVRFYIDNKTQAELYFLNLGAAITHIDMYVVSENGILTTYPPGGTLRPFENRSLPVPKTNFNLGKSPKTLFVAIQSSQSLIFSNNIGTKDATYAFLRLDERISFFCCGIYFILALYNFVIYFNTRYSPFLWYSLFEIGVIFYLLHVSGHGYQHLWQSYPIINADANFHVAIAIFAACFFCMSFLNTRNVIPHYHFYLKILLVFYSGALLMQPLGFIPLANTLCQISILIISFSLWMAGVLAYIKKQRTARFYVVGWTIYLLAIILYMLSESSLVPQLNAFVRDYYVLRLGSTLEGCFLAFALADRVRETRQQARDANELALKRAYDNEALMAKQTQLIEEKLHLEQQNNSKSELPALLEQMRTERSKNTKLHVPTTEGVLWIPTQDIIRLEAMRSYCSIYTTNGKRFIASHPLSDFEKQLDTVEFMRVHKSHLVNLSQIQEYIRGEGGSLVMKDGSTVNVSRSSKAALLARLDS
jgi:two-component system, sensor histidine kinase LadS